MNAGPPPAVTHNYTCGEQPAKAVLIAGRNIIRLTGVAAVDSLSNEHNGRPIPHFLDLAIV
jgi:hypothetical protein